MADGISANAERVLRALQKGQPVLITGPPATGKTHLLHEVRELFRADPGGPVSDPEATIPIPDTGNVPSGLLPSPDRTERQVLEIAMNQNSKYREFWRAPELVPGTNGEIRISKGLLWQGNEHAKTDDGTTLVEIDEFNRGPVVQILGPAISALEADKRLDPNSVGGVATTATFPLPNDNGDLTDYGLSPHLYVVAAQNNADTSVEPVDVAVLRRFTPIELGPDPEVLSEYFGLDSLDGDLPETPASAEDVYLAAIRAWEAVNHRLSVGRSPDHQIGHGVLMSAGAELPDTADEALSYVRTGWEQIEKHISEVFFSNVENQAATLYVEEAVGHPYTIGREPFGALDVPVLDRPPLDNYILYKLLKAIADATT
jgi:5-methylcytosine-specific restriction protein B